MGSPGQRVSEMSWQERFYNWSYRRGAPGWDTGITPREVVEVIEGAHPRPPGRALDLGCGTGTNVLYLVRHGFEVVGIDLSPVAIEAAGRKLESVSEARVLLGDVTALSSLGVEGPFDFLLDIGCFHGITRSRRPDYVREVARVARPGALLMMWAFGARGVWRFLGMGVTRQEIEQRFGAGFALEQVVPGRRPTGSAWYSLRRQ